MQELLPYASDLESFEIAKQFAKSATDGRGLFNGDWLKKSHLAAIPVLLDWTPEEFSQRIDVGAHCTRSDVVLFWLFDEFAEIPRCLRTSTATREILAVESKIFIFRHLVMSIDGEFAASVSPPEDLISFVGSQECMKEVLGATTNEAREQFSAAITRFRSCEQSSYKYYKEVAQIYRQHPA